MANYRIFPSTNGPVSAITNAGNFIAAVSFATTGPTWFTGYYMWLGSNSSTSPVKCALWSVTAQNTGVVVPGSVVTSGTLTVSSWNYIPIPTPIQLSQGKDPATPTASSIYMAAIGVNGNFPDTNSFWSAGITNGPLYAFASAQMPYSMAQGQFTTAGSDPSVTFPNAVSGTDNFWVDVQVTDTAPTGYSGTYRLWPNKSDANGATVVDSAVAYNVATEIDVSQTVVANYIHYYSPSGSTGGLATTADIWDTSNQSLIATVSNPTWLTEPGSAATQGNGWVKTALPANVVLPSGKYRVSVYNSNGASGGWNAKDAQTGYFTTGVGSGASGITWGPLTAPNLANAQTGTFFPGTGVGATNAQPVFSFDGTNSYPNFSTGNNPPQVYWVDLEVTIQPPVISYTSPVDSQRIWNNVYRRAVRKVPNNPPTPVINFTGTTAAVSTLSIAGSLKISKSGLVSSVNSAAVLGSAHSTGAPVIVNGLPCGIVSIAILGNAVFKPPPNYPVRYWRARLVNPGK